MVLHPRHRGDCAHFFVAPQQTERIHFDGPVAVINAIEHAAARAGRTWNDQFTYVMGICLGMHLPDFEEARSVEDWRALVSECAFRFSEGEAWRSFAAMRKMTS